MHRLSVIISNYNYGRFVAAAIDSALALDWDDVEVIVVDDGSTDESVSVINGYGARVVTISQENSTQRVACNSGFARSTGDVIIFLDSDDVLDPQLPKALAAVWHDGISKVQVVMRRIDAAGTPLGSTFPSFAKRPTPEQIRHWAVTTTAYPTPPGSGNAYSRQFLLRLFPLDSSCGDFSDSACLAAAPYFGDVETIDEPLVGYRVHEDNDSNLLSDPDRFPREVRRARDRYLFARRLVEPTVIPDERPLFRSRELLQLRVAASRLRPGDLTLTGDGRLRMAADAVLALFRPGPEGVSRRMVVSGWVIAMLVVPEPAARRLLRLRYART